MPTRQPSTASPTSTPEVTPIPTNTLPLPIATPGILAPASISRLEQVGLVEYTPWDLVMAVAWSPDGNLLAASAGQAIYLYTPDLQMHARLDAGTYIASLAFHPQGTWLAAGGRDGQVQIWDLHTQEMITRLAAHKKGVNDVAFSPDGSILASAGNDAVARLWDPNTGENLSQMIGGTYSVPSISFSPAGTELAISNGELIRIRDVETSRFTHTLRSEGSNFSTAWSPLGSAFAAGNTAGDIFVWDLPSKEPSGSILLPVQTITDSTSMIWSLSFTPDGSMLAAADNDGVLYFWGVKENAMLSSTSTNSKGITSLAFSPDGRYLLTGGLDGMLRLWASP